MEGPEGKARHRELIAGELHKLNLLLGAGKVAEARKQAKIVLALVPLAFSGREAFDLDREPRIEPQQYRDQCQP